MLPTGTLRRPAGGAIAELPGFAEGALVGAGRRRRPPRPPARRRRRRARRRPLRRARRQDAAALRRRRAGHRGRHLGPPHDAAQREPGAHRPRPPSWSPPTRANGRPAQSSTPSCSTPPAPPPAPSAAIPTCLAARRATSPPRRAGPPAGARARPAEAGRDAGLCVCSLRGGGRSRRASKPFWTRTPQPSSCRSTPPSSPALPRPISPRRRHPHPALDVARARWLRRLLCRSSDCRLNLIPPLRAARGGGGASYGGGGVMGRTDPGRPYPSVADRYFPQAEIPTRHLPGFAREEI